MGSKTGDDLRSGVLQCIDSGLDVLGPVSKEVVYSYLSRNQLSKEQIPDEPWRFTEALKKLFGRGEEVLERAIVAELKHSYGLTSSGGVLVEILAAMRLAKNIPEKKSTTSRAVKQVSRTQKKSGTI